VADEELTLVMGGVRKSIDNDWWFHVTGKGNKNRSITVCGDMPKALKRHRKHLGLA